MEPRGETEHQNSFKDGADPISALAFEASYGAPTEKGFFFSGDSPRRNQLFRKNPRMKLTFPTQNSNETHFSCARFERESHFLCQNAYFSRNTTHGKCTNAYFSRNMAFGACYFEAKCVFLENYDTRKMQKCVFLEKYSTWSMWLRTAEKSSDWLRKAQNGSEWL